MPATADMMQAQTADIVNLATAARIIGRSRKIKGGIAMLDARLICAELVEDARAGALSDSDAIMLAEIALEILTFP